MKYSDLLREEGFQDPFDTCLTVHTKNFDFHMAFIEFETNGELGILATDENGREKLKIINKEFVEAIEVLYADDINLEDTGEKKEDRMFH